MTNNKPDSFWSLIAGITKNNIRWQIATSIGLAVELLVIIVLVYLCIGLARQNAYLAEHRIMFGFADSDGVFISTEKRPNNIVKRYARDYIANMKNFDRDTVVSNTKYAVAMMNPESQLQAARRLRDRNKEIVSNGIHQSFVIDNSTEQLIEHDTGYAYTVKGYQKQFTGPHPIAEGTGPREITIELTKVPPTQSRQEGLWVESGRGL